MNAFNYCIEQLVERVARGRQDRRTSTERAFAAPGTRTVRDAERALDGYLDDPNVDEAIKAHIRALEPSNEAS